ncbi:myristoyl transferase [Ktedonosporobacter rubrisoli]|uniref:Myristoyl transferase n=1 Tax=Ktedonosporobacter rubrisoli TaxID=2509675 RepID=A0A4V0YYZ5_KTERU|nr:ABC transporter substrate-binding protein [Ktedonosporobacter rubrisoli]QBD77941.1 myristoyl transferase [Ktedonosporobacter rubrisoli]
MSTRHRASTMLPILSCLLLLTFLLAACGGAPAATQGNTKSGPSVKDVSIGLGYIPDVQFAPFYMAKSKGYYNAAGLNVTFHHGVVPDLIGSMVAGKNDFVFAGGDELLQARDKNKSVKAIDVATIFQKYAVSLIVPADSPIKTLADMKGHTIGVPGPFGSTYTGLLALLYKAHLSLADVKVQSIGFTQVAALLGHKVDAVMGYSNNEPLQLRRHNFNVRTFDVSDYVPLVSNGIITTEETYHSQPQMVRAFVQATLKGLKDVVADPDKAIEVCKTYVPGMTDTTQALEVLKATIPIWQGNGRPGYNDSAAWQSTEQFLVAQKMIAPVSDLTQAYTNQAVE